MTLLQVAVVLAVFLVPRICEAQSGQTARLVPHKMLHGDFADWPKIRQDVRFTDEKLMPVSGVQKDRVLVLEDGVEQAGATLQQDDTPASICLVLDQSSSMKKSGKALIAAARELIAAANPADEVAILSFDVQVNLEQDFTSDAGKLEAALQHIRFGGGSGFFNAVWVAVDQLAARAPERRKIVVTLSDGADNYSHVQFGDLLKKLKYPGAPLIYSLSPPSHTFGQQQNVQGLQNLQMISETTGGASYESRSQDRLKGDAAEISQDIRSSYGLEYTSTHTERDGKLHKVEIKVKPGGSASKVKAYFRQEYYAPSN